MLKNLSWVIVLVLVINVKGVCQDNQINAPDLNYSAFWDFYSQNDIGARVWGMGGAGLANVNDLSAMVTNPAALAVTGKISFYGEILSKNDNPWLREVSNMYLESPMLIPDFFGVGFRISQGINAGFGFLAPKTFNIHLGKLGVVTPDEPIPEEYIQAYTHFRARQILVPMSVQVVEGLTLGANVNYNFISVRQQLIYEGESEVEFFNFKLGALVQPTRRFSLGLTFVPQKSFATETEWRGDHDEYLEKYEKTILPWELGIGFCFHDLGYPLNFAFDMKVSKNSEIDKQVDKYDYHLGVEFEVNQQISLLFGYFSRFDYRKPPAGSLLAAGELDQHFVTAGLTLKLERFLLRASLRNSDLLSDGLMEQTHFSVGTGFDF